MSEPATVFPIQPLSDVQLVEQAVANMDRVGAGIAALKEAYAKTVYDVATTAGMKAAKDARQVIRQPRFEVERIRKEAKAPLLALGRRLDNEAKRITGELEALEAPIDGQIRAEEERLDGIRKAAVQVERARVEGIQERIATIIRFPMRAVGQASKDIAALHDQLKSLAEFDFQEFKQAADVEFTKASSALAQAFSAAVAHEVAAEQLRKDQEALAAQQREQAERDRKAREEQEARQRALDEQAASLNRQQEEIARQQAPKAVTPPLSPALVEADDAPAFDHNALRAPEPQPWRPSADELVRAVAITYGATMAEALQWLSSTNWTEA